MILTLYPLPVESGKIGSIGLSECLEATLTRASKVCTKPHSTSMIIVLRHQPKVGKVAAVEIEVSLWTYEEETRKGNFSFSIWLVGDAYI
jgi:hypothetical protein